MNQVFAFHSPSQENKSLKRYRNNNNIRVKGVNLNSDDVDELLDYNYVSFLAHTILSGINSFINLFVSEDNEKKYIDEEKWIVFETVQNQIKSDLDLIHILMRLYDID